MSLSSVISVFGEAWGSSNATEAANAECDPVISSWEFYLWMLIPSTIEVVIFAMFVRRKGKCLNCLWGRPGIITPLDIFEMRNRTSFAAAFGSISFLCSEVIFESKYVIPYSGPVGFRVFVIILSVIVYGIVFLPIFVALTMRTSLSYFLGCLHLWVFAFIGYYETFSCSEALGSRLTMKLVARDLPKLVSLTYLLVMMHYRFVMALLKVIAKRASVEGHVLNSTEDKIRAIRESPTGRHIRKNFLPPKPSIVITREGIKGKVLDIIMPIWKLWKYRWNPDFQYSGRFLAVMTVSAILVYKLTSEILIFIVDTIQLYVQYFEDSLDYIGWVGDVTDTEDIELLRDWLITAWYLLYAFRICVIVSACLQLILSSLLLLHSVSSYRKNLLALHKGIHVHIPARAEKSNASHMLGSLRYGGYQIGYTGWAYFIQFTLLLLVTSTFAFIITLYAEGRAQFITDLILTFWPIPVSTIILNIIQILVAKFLFLQERGAVLAIENRRGFFLFSYFMFFYNIFIGLVSCLLRILKAIIIGAVSLGRLDNSTLPRKFQLFDPGFDAYVGFLHMENAHRHPVVLGFIAILRAYVPERKEETDFFSKAELESVESDKIALTPQFKFRRACHNWCMFYTLHYNPQLRLLRKHALQAREDKLVEAEALRKEMKRKNKRPNVTVEPEVSVVNGERRSYPVQDMAATTKAS